MTEPKDLQTLGSIDEESVGTMPEVQSITGFFVVDQTGDEGLIGMQTAYGWVPAIGCDEKRVEQLRPLGAATAKETGRTVRMVRFTTRTVLEEYEP